MQIRRSRDSMRNEMGVKKVGVEEEEALVNFPIYPAHTNPHVLSELPHAHPLIIFSL